MRDWLKHLRTENGLTLKTLGEKLDISESYCCSIESGERQKDINLSMLTRLSEVFETPLDKIIHMETEYKENERLVHHQSSSKGFI